LIFHNKKIGKSDTLKTPSPRRARHEHRAKSNPNSARKLTIVRGFNNRLPSCWTTGWLANLFTISKGLIRKMNLLERQSVRKLIRQRKFKILFFFIYEHVFNIFIKKKS